MTLNPIVLQLSICILWKYQCVCCFSMNQFRWIWVNSTVKKAHWKYAINFTWDKCQLGTAKSIHCWIKFKMNKIYLSYSLLIKQPNFEEIHQNESISKQGGWCIHSNVKVDQFKVEKHKFLFVLPCRFIQSHLMPTGNWSEISFEVVDRNFQHT